jgi:hypothetical protein
VISPNGSYRKVTNVRLRPVPEWRSCVAYTPDDPRLYLLNLNSWLILELCDGRSAEDIEAAYLAVVAQKLDSDPASTFHDGLLELERTKLIERSSYGGDAA